MAMAAMGMGRQSQNSGLVKTRAGIEFSTAEKRDKIPVLQIPMCQEATDRRFPNEFNFVPSEPGAFTEIYQSATLRKIYNPTRHSHGPVDRRKRGTGQKLLEQERQRAEKAELSRQYGIRQQAMKLAEQECDDLSKLQDWSKQRRDELRQKIAERMPEGMGQAAAIQKAAKEREGEEEEMQEFMEEEINAFGRPDASRIAQQRREKYKKQQELKKKKEDFIARKKAKRKKSKEETRSIAQFVRNPEAALRKELANAKIDGRGDSKAPLQLEKAELADEFRLTLQTRAMAKWREDGIEVAAAPRNERERFAQAMEKMEAGHGHSHSHGHSHGHTHHGGHGGHGGHRRRSVVQCNLEDTEFQDKVGTALQQAEIEAAERKDAVLDRQKAGLVEFHARIKDQNEGLKSGKRRLVRNFAGFKDAFKKNRAKVDKRKEELNQRKGLFASRTRANPNTRALVEVVAKVPVWQGKKGPSKSEIRAKKLQDHRKQRKEAYAFAGGDEAHAQRLLNDPRLKKTALTKKQELSAIKMGLNEGIDLLDQRMDAWKDTGQLADAKLESPFDLSGRMRNPQAAFAAEADDDEPITTVPSGPELIEAAENGNTKILRHCLIGGIKPTTRNEEGMPALSLAAKFNRLQSAVLLTAQQLGERNERLEHILNAKAKGLEGNGRTALHEAAENGHADMVGFLLNKGADGNAQDADGATPLMLACKKNDAEVAAMLLSGRVATEVKNKKGETAMHYAARHASTELVDLLLKGGAFTIVEDEDGETPANHAYDIARDVSKTNQIKVGHNRVVRQLDLLNWHWEQFQSNAQLNRHGWVDKNPGGQESSPTRLKQINDMLRKRELREMKNAKKGALRKKVQAVGKVAKMTGAGAGAGGDASQSWGNESWGDGWGDGSYSYDSSYGDGSSWQGTGAHGEEWQSQSEWAEAWDENGARYFYHTQTGETTWDAPEGW